MAARASELAEAYRNWGAVARMSALEPDPGPLPSFSKRPTRESLHEQETRLHFRCSEERPSEAKKKNTRRRAC
jgi:hypothetical protein